MTGSALRWTVIALLGLCVGAATASARQTPQRADIVVDFGDGRVAARQVPFDGPFTGLDLLSASGLDLELAGNAVCKIGGVGCPGTDCFCACATVEACRFWHYHHGAGSGGWEMSATGPADAALADGAVDGWVWSDVRAPITATATTRGALRGVAWLAARQQENGSIADHAGLTAELVFAARAAGVPLEDLARSGGDPVRFLETATTSYVAESVAAAGKLAAAIAAAGRSPRWFGGNDVIATIEQRYNPAIGRYGTSAWDQSWAILGLVAAWEPVPEAALTALSVMGPPEGGWGAAPGSAPDVDTTGLALQALAAAGRTGEDPAVRSGVAYLKRQQSADGGWGHGAAASNANSTAYAMQGLIAAGEDLASLEWRSEQGALPVERLLAMQFPEGRFEHETSPADLVATLQAVPAIAGWVQGADGAGAAAPRAVAWVLGHRTAEGGYDGFQPGATLDAVIALAANGYDPDLSAPSGLSASDFLRSAGDAYVTSGPAAAGKFALGVAALGEDPRAFAGVDAVAAIEAALNPSSGAYGTGTTWDNAYALLGLKAAEADVPALAVAYLLAAPSPAGGWGFNALAEAPDVDSTALALQALAAAGVPADAVQVRLGVETLARLQLPDGTFPGFDGLPSATSTAMALSGLVAAGQATDGAAWQRDHGLRRRGPMDALLALQDPTGGFPGYAGPTDPAATYAALFALSGARLPVIPGAPDIPSTLYLPIAVHQ